MSEHKYSAKIKWTGNTGKGTLDYKSYERSHTIIIKNKTHIVGSSDVVFRGDKTKHNPEELFIASISSCHMLWYLHLCAINNIIVIGYSDEVHGIMFENEKRAGRRPRSPSLFDHNMQVPNHSRVCSPYPGRAQTGACVPSDSSSGCQTRRARSTNKTPSR